MKKDTFRVVTRGADGQIRIRDYPSQDALLKRHSQIGIDDCSTDLELRGLPVFRGLIGPMPEGKNVIRYESPEVFETLTKEWGTANAPGRCGPAAARALAASAGRYAWFRQKRAAGRLRRLRDFRSLESGYARNHAEPSSEAPAARPR